MPDKAVVHVERTAVYVALSYCDYSDPREITAYWRVSKTVRDPYRPRFPQHGDMLRKTDCVGGMMHYFGDGYSLYFPSNMRAERIETREVPCPKVRKSVETRYHNGRWEKYLKTSGWVDVE